MDQSGCTAQKASYGLPVHWQAWKLQDLDVNGLGAAAIGPATDTNGTMDYDEILRFSEENCATVVYDGPCSILL